MHTLIPLESIYVPQPQADKVYKTEIFEKSYSFTGLKSLLGAADVSKAGDRMAGLAADSPLCRDLLATTNHEFRFRPLPF